MHHAVVPGHSGCTQAEDLNEGEGAVDAIEDFGGLAGLWYQLGDDRTGGLGFHQVQRPGAHGGEQGDGQYQHPHTAQPVGKGAPKKKTFGQRFNDCENRGACSGETGDRLKEAVDEALEKAQLRVQFSVKKEGQRTENTDK